MTNNAIIKCPTYKDSFTLRKALIELNIKWVNGWKLDGMKGGIRWKDLWQRYNYQTIYIVVNNQLVFGNINSIPRLYSKIKQISVKDLITNEIFK